MNNCNKTRLLYNNVIILAKDDVISILMDTHCLWDINCIEKSACIQ